MKKISLIILAAMLSASGFAQSKAKLQGWHLKDFSKDGYAGISLDQAYEFLKSKNLKPKTVIVGVVDSGIDTLHEDLKPVLWRNPKEIPGNGIDDDKNGYIDDVYGWNFLGGKDGRNVDKDSYEAARVYWSLKDKWDGKSGEGLSGRDKWEYENFMRAKDNIQGSEEDQMMSEFYKQLLPGILEGDSIIQAEIGKKEYEAADLKDYTPTNPKAKSIKDNLTMVSKANGDMKITNTMLVGELQGMVDKANAAKLPPPNYRNDIVKDKYDDINDKYYGNNDLQTGSPMHGTHVAGIIAAKRNNKLGMDGVADDVQILTVRAVPDGDEHDKDIALGIRYAVDNGAKVINMSFGKSFSPQKAWVDDAYRYAAAKDVLLVHAAGNDNKNIDSTFNYPNAIFEDGKGRAQNLITVGASGDTASLGTLTAPFSNYGKAEVDIFAPGMAIYSTLPGGNQYGNQQGTSMASPVVAGVAALVRSYFPTLSAVQVKSILEESAAKIPYNVYLPGSDTYVKLTDLSRTGGIVNAYNAVRMAYDKVYGKGKVTTDAKNDTDVEKRRSSSTKKAPANANQIRDTDATQGELKIKRNL